MREIKSTLNGKEYWRNLEQFADTPEVKQLLQKEFPDNAEDFSNPVSRRKFIGLMSASLAFAARRCPPPLCQKRLFRGNCQ